MIQLATLLMLSGCLDHARTPVSNIGVTNPVIDDPIANNPPTITGIPGTETKYAEEYFFEPTVNDPDGDPLTFNVQNLPSWARFNSETGALSGTPSFADLGTYSEILIGVHDGVASAWLPQFSVSVIQTSTGSVTLSWAAPTRNTDGSTLVDLASYKIYYGLSAGNYSRQIEINNPGITTYVVDNLSPNTYYFVSTSINADGIESDFSNVASRTVN